jgi:hypothetical protein
MSDGTYKEEVQRTNLDLCKAITVLVLNFGFGNLPVLVSRRDIGSKEFL